MIEADQGGVDDSVGFIDEDSFGFMVRNLPIWKSLEKKYGIYFEKSSVLL